MKEQNNKNVARRNVFKEHFFANDSECNPEFNWTTDSMAVLTDIKVLMKEHYIATFTDDGNALKLSFNNGQSFIVTVTECA